jgi:hypothetical protein
MNPPVPLERDQNFAIMGGAISMVSKNWKLFVPGLSNFWLHEMLLGHLEQKMFPADTKQI